MSPGPLMAGSSVPEGGKRRAPQATRWRERTDTSSRGAPPGIVAEPPLEEWGKGKAGEAHISQCQPHGQGLAGEK